jgi:hypothetical protein
MKYLPRAEHRAAKQQEPLALKVSYERSSTQIIIILFLGNSLAEGYRRYRALPINQEEPKFAVVARSRLAYGDLILSSRGCTPPNGRGFHYGVIATHRLFLFNESPRSSS